MHQPTVASIYARLTKVAHRSPKRALQDWLKVVLLQEPQARVILETHRRCFESLARLARSGASSGDAQGIEDLISAGEARIASANIRTAVQDETTAIRFNQPSSPPVTKTLLDMPERRRPADLVQFQREAVTWSGPQLMDWMIRGLQELKDPDEEPHLSFLPVKLYPIGNYVEQVAGTILELIACDLSVGPALVSAIQDHLKGRWTGADRRFDADIWTIYSNLNLSDPEARIPTRYLRQVLPAIKSPRAVAEIAISICDAVFRTVPAPSRQIWLFEEFLKAFQDANVSASLCVAQLNEFQDDLGHDVPKAKETFGHILQDLGLPSQPTDDALDRLLILGRLNLGAAGLFGRAVATAKQLRSALETRAGPPKPAPVQPLPRPLALETL